MTTGQPASSGPTFSPDQFAQLAAARRRASRIRRAAGTARFSAWTTGIFGAFTLLGALFGSIPALLLGLAMIACGMNELRAAARLLALDPAAPCRLAWNQAFLCLALCAYCGWNLIRALVAPPDPNLAALSGAGELAASADHLVRGISVLVYSCAIMLCTLVATLTGLYYASRARHLRDYLRATPAWVVDVQRAA